MIGINNVRKHIREEFRTNRKLKNMYWFHLKYYSYKEKDERTVSCEDRAEMLNEIISLQDSSDRKFTSTLKKILDINDGGTVKDTPISVIVRCTNFNVERKKMILSKMDEIGILHHRLLNMIVTKRD